MTGYGCKDTPIRIDEIQYLNVLQEGIKLWLIHIMKGYATIKCVKRKSS